MKIFLFDIDGVLIRVPHYFSQELENLWYIGAAEIMDSFYVEWPHKDCLVGKGDEEVCIVPFLEKFWWEKSASDYLQEQFAFESKYVDHDFFAFIQQLREQGNVCCLATD